MPGRSIHSNLLLIRDIIDFSTIKNGPCALVSIDPEKAFDRVNWKFLLKVLQKLNFGDNFCKWVSILYRDIYGQLLINGSLSDPVLIEREGGG